MVKEILFATTNQGKARELKQAFQKAGLKIMVKTNRDFDNPPIVDEYGTTFEQNAKLKAHALANFSGLITLADDSGLMVDALDGAPGVHSARYAGQGHNDAQNNAKLLAELGGIVPEKRTAKFTTTIVASKPGEFAQDLVVTGECQGQILAAPRGEDGFGYDPLFFVPAKNKSFAQMTMQEKNEISHRGKAIVKLLEAWPKWLERVE
ncbi:XTP/dITP diphosphatase [Lactobacillus sp. ESL0684]|uniref:XTP/dITP diphosphatase n=1 Tax=Lactobacillus sp. ESL0684 TaxID=2983213 RepID=UPI0023F874AF|nr:XTP/dITP diphosphatase [Lactobacillus sp. ESL0684]WEV43294.1 XTP/dITP diphosphatase [Lactobacillus sp. ESL0684]